MSKSPYQFPLGSLVGSTVKIHPGYNASDHLYYYHLGLSNHLLPPGLLQSPPTFGTSTLAYATFIPIDYFRFSSQMALLKTSAMQYYFLQNLAEALYFTQSKSKSLIMAHKPLCGTAPSRSSESFPTIHLLTQPHWPPCQSLNLPNTLLGCLYFLHILPGTLSPWMSLYLVSSPLTSLCSPSQ